MRPTRTYLGFNRVERGVTWVKDRQSIIKKALVTRILAVAVLVLSAWVCPSLAETGVQVLVINLPTEFEGEELALAGTVNGWNNSVSTSYVANDTLSFTFNDIDITPLDGGWLNTPEGANAAFSFHDPGTWNQRIVGDYGSNDNNFRVALEGDMLNTVVIDAQYSLTAPPWLLIDIEQPSIYVNGVLQLPTMPTADVTISVINLPAEFDGEQLALAGTVNDWNNNVSISTITNNTLTYTFNDIAITPLGIGWPNAPAGANAAFSFFDPGTWNQRIVGNYGSNDNNFRVALSGDTMNTVVIDAQYSLTAPPWLVIDIEQPSIIVNGVVQLPPPVITNLSISVIHLPVEFEGLSIALLGSVVQFGDLEATVVGNSLSFVLEGLELSVLGSEWEERPLDANATFVFVDPQTLEQKIIGDYDSDRNDFRVRLAAGMNNSVVIDANHLSGTAPLTIDKTRGIHVNGNIHLPNRTVDPNMYTWPGGKWKALIMSYDDGPDADTQMVDLFNANGIVGTFNLASGFLDSEGFITSGQVSGLYQDHEVANHSEHHPYLAQGDTTSIRSELENCGNTLAGLVGHEINGMAYPFGGADSGAYDYRVIDIAQNLGIRYARTTNDTRSLEIPGNLPDGLMQWGPTINDWDGVTFVNQLIDWNENRMALLYMWGHSHFLDDSGWSRMTAICEEVGNRGDIWYARNIEVADYLRAICSLVYTDGSVLNPSADVSVWVVTDSGPVELEPGESMALSAVEDNDLIPRQSSLQQNYPNPFNPSTSFRYTVTRDTHVKVNVFDVRGQLVTQLVDAVRVAGTHEESWDGTNMAGHDVASGMYLLRMDAGSFSDTKRMVLLK